MKKTVFITGGAGFIGTNASLKFFKKGYKIIIFDNLSRKGADKNLLWLKKNIDFKFCKGDVSNYSDLKKCFKREKKIDAVLHLAAQVAVTLSVENPRKDFETNALGTFNVCEAVRNFSPKAALLYASTNKVYGEMADVKIREKKTRYTYKDLINGVSEKRNLDFHSPYGCSKGTGDQYVVDYSRIYGLKGVSLRQSCIYGPHQFGVEDQGWVAWFIIRALLKKPITIYGDGKQVRDILYIDDLTDLYLKAVSNINRVRGQAYSIGGGPKNTVSLLELISSLEKKLGYKINYRFSDWRPGDQKVYISDVRKVKRDLGWKPKVNPSEGLDRLINWVKENIDIFRGFNLLK